MTGRGPGTEAVATGGGGCARGHELDARVCPISFTSLSIRSCDDLVGLWVVGWPLSRLPFYRPGNSLGEDKPQPHASGCSERWVARRWRTHTRTAPGR